MRNPIKYKLGDIAITLEGEKIEIVQVSEIHGREWVKGKDGIARYNNDADRGRTTGTAHDFSYPKNFIQEYKPMNAEQRCQIYVKANAHRIGQDKSNKDQPARAGQIWHHQEDAKLRERFVDKEISINGCAFLHQRSELAIECRLIKLGILDENLQPVKTKTKTKTISIDIETDLYKIELHAYQRQVLEMIMHSMPAEEHSLNLGLTPKQRKLLT